MSLGVQLVPPHDQHLFSAWEKPQLMWHYLPTEAYDPTPLSSHGPIIYGVLVGLWALLILGLCLVIFYFRRLPSLANRSPTLTLLTALPALTNAIWILWRPLLGGQVGCAMDLWLMLFAFSFWIFLNASRFIRLIFLFRMHDALLDSVDKVSLSRTFSSPATSSSYSKPSPTQNDKDHPVASMAPSLLTPMSMDPRLPRSPRHSSHDPLNSSHPSMISSPIVDVGTMDYIDLLPMTTSPGSTSTAQADRGKEHLLKKPQGPHTEPTSWDRDDAVNHLWWYKYRYFLREKSLVLTVLSLEFLYILFFIVLPHAIMGSGPPPPDTSLGYAQGQCLVDWPFWPGYVVLVVAKSVLYPAQFFFMRDVRDAYGLRWELRAHTICKLIATPFFFLIILIPNIPQNARTWVMFVMNAIFLLGGIFTSLLFPLYDALTMRSRRNNVTFSLDSFHRMLRDVSEFNEFLIFCVKDFSVENALFHRRCTRLFSQHTSSALTTSSSTTTATTSSSPHVSGKHDPTGTVSPSSSAYKLEALSIYETYLQPHSPFELNIDVGTRRRFQARWDAGEDGPEVFRELVDEVERIMFQHTYPRFLSTREDPSTTIIPS
ncbi:MAG: hypothetical protein DHS80DRAFT_28389 [Piptocephalis tieghemiana]|nr:MAG: hypothetical protein DHS80DRAFT_28389 [Piptocephalis tieghemiana]